MLLRTNSVFTFFLVIINTILALMASQYMWSTDTILQWGGMSGSMPVAQTLSLNLCFVFTFFMDAFRK